MRNVTKFTFFVLIIFALTASLALAQTTTQPMQQGTQGMRGMPCCMMGGGMGMGMMMTIGVLTALLQISATTALFALTVFLWRRSRAQ